MADTSNQTLITDATGMTDALKALGRYVYAIFTICTGLFAALGTGNAETIFTFFQDNVGEAVAAVLGVSGILTVAYGVYRTYRRGQKLVEVEPFVPNEMLTLKSKV